MSWVRRVGGAVRRVWWASLLGLLIAALGAYAVGGLEAFADALLGEGEGISWPRALAAIVAGLGAVGLTAALADKAAELIFVNAGEGRPAPDPPGAFVLPVSLLDARFPSPDDCRNRAGDKTLAQAAADEAWADMRFPWQQAFRTVEWALRDRQEPLRLHLVPSQESETGATCLAAALEALIRNSGRDRTVEVRTRSSPRKEAHIEIVIHPPPRKDGFDEVQATLDGVLAEERRIARRSRPEVAIDITGGRKTWSAVAAIRALEPGVRFCYVRDPYDPANPVDTFAVRARRVDPPGI